MIDESCRKLSNNDDNRDGRFICGVIEGFYGKPWTCDQRKDLFKRLKEFKLNTFLYAPKDDSKHRSDWRRLYSQVEADELRSLIAEAKSKGIDFYYSLAPGLDMIYSDETELNLLLKKYDQLVELGCESFAILFDDIEPNLVHEKDRLKFKNYASAQVSVSNMIYRYLNKPNFLFCPTEYCESRAVPSLTESVYLNTIGSELDDGIDFMWSGSRVISRLITDESIETLTKVIRRSPVIWENLHANDYDKKRVFLGPYSGRSTKIIPKLRGVLTNPNCEYEANYIAIHTLAQWSRCTEDVNLNNCCNPKVDKKKYLQELDKSTNSSEKKGKNEQSVYNPERALLLAIKDWLPKLNEHRALPPGLNLTIQGAKVDNDELNEASKQLISSNNVNDEEDKIIDVEASNVEMLPEESQLSASSSIGTNEKSEMDISCSPGNANYCDSYEMSDVDDNGNSSNGNQFANKLLSMEQKRDLDCLICSDSDKMKKSDDHNNEVASTSVSSSLVINIENLALIVDLFYLPFEHGSNGYTLLEDIKWLRDNSEILISKRESLANEQLVDEKEQANIKQYEIEFDNIEHEGDRKEKLNDSGKLVKCWIDRAERLSNLCTYISQLVNRLIYNCPNEMLIIELYPYLADMRDVASLIIDYIKFLRYRTSTLHRFYYSNNNKYQAASSDEQEPWVHRGGLIGDVQRLLST